MGVIKLIAVVFEKQYNGLEMEEKWKFGLKFRPIFWYF